MTYEAAHTKQSLQITSGTIALGHVLPKQGIQQYMRTSINPDRPPEHHNIWWSNWWESDLDPPLSQHLEMQEIRLLICLKWTDSTTSREMRTYSELDDGWPARLQQPLNTNGSRISVNRTSNFGRSQPRNARKQITFFSKFNFLMFLT